MSDLANVRLQRSQTCGILEAVEAAEVEAAWLSALVLASKVVCLVLCRVERCFVSLSAPPKCCPQTGHAITASLRTSGDAIPRPGCSEGRPRVEDRDRPLPLPALFRETSEAQGRLTLLTDKSSGESWIEVAVDDIVAKSGRKIVRPVWPENLSSKLRIAFRSWSDLENRAEGADGSNVDDIVGISGWVAVDVLTNEVDRNLDSNGAGVRGISWPRPFPGMGTCRWGAVNKFVSKLVAVVVVVRQLAEEKILKQKWLSCQNFEPMEEDQPKFFGTVF